MCLLNRQFKYLDHLPNMVCVTGESGEIVFANKKFKRYMPDVDNVFTFLFGNSTQMDQMIQVLNDNKVFSKIVEIKEKTRKSDDFQEGVVIGNTSKNGWHKVYISKVENKLFSNLCVVSQFQFTNTVNVMNLQNMLVTSLFPKEILNSYPKKLIKRHRFCNVLFVDIVGFTPMCAESDPEDVVHLLNELFTTFDSITEKYKIFKYETVGDAYVGTTGVFSQSDNTLEFDEDNASEDATKTQNMFECAKAMLLAANEFVMLNTLTPIQLRIGINSGVLCSSIVGTKVPKFCLFGDTINVASRMQTTADPNTIHMSATSHQMLINKADVEFRGISQIKGKGAMPTFMWKAPVLPSLINLQHIYRSKSF